MTLVGALLTSMVMTLMKLLVIITISIFRRVSFVEISHFAFFFVSYLLR